MKRALKGLAFGVGLLAILGAAVAAPAAAGGHTAVGVRYGYNDASGDLFEKSGDLGGGDLIGIHLIVSLLPLIELEAAGEYVSDELNFDEGVFEGIEAAGKADYEDLTLYLTGKLDVLTIPIFPIKGYIGGGFNVHYADLTVDDAEPVSGTTEDLEAAIEKVTGEKTRVGWHAVAGLRLSFAALPASFFLEGRVMNPFEGDGVPDSKSVYAGVSLQL
jgi:hypothetical protein